MSLLFTAAVFLLVMICAALVGLKVWVRPQEAIDRVAGLAPAREEEVAKHPSLVFHDLVAKLGNLMPVNPRDANVIQRKMIRAGIRNPKAMKYFYGSKVLFGVLLPAVMLAAVANSEAESSNKIMAVLASVAAGFFAPNEYLNLRSKKRTKEIRRGLPNALDLLVVCVESGLGLDQAVIQVAKDLDQAHPEISEEFAMVNYELKAGKRRVDALRNLGERSNVDDLKKLVAVLIQADRFGTGVAQSLRSHAEYMRVQARQTAEEKAAKLGVKLVFPIFFCILPSLFIVTVGPMAVRIVREVLPMMGNI
ncbi:MAG: type II secretion system F family protein [Acidobacteria bacterium]|nr:type II secretion system F family protein [Acidobacteriota bacterium]